jgi:hypothetical protein
MHFECNLIDAAEDIMVNNGQVHPHMQTWTQLCLPRFRHFEF